MRDDVHRSAPVSKVWKRFMADCYREATSRVNGPIRLETAVRNDLRRDLRPAVVRQLVEVASAGGGGLFGTQEALSEMQCRTVLTTLERKAIENTAWVGDAAKGILLAVREHVDSMLREIDCHLRMTERRDLKGCNQYSSRMSEHGSRFDAQQVVLEALAGKVRAMPSKRLSPLGLDMEL